jgi:hypothetical protein
MTKDSEQAGLSGVDCPIIMRNPLESHIQAV